MKKRYLFISLLLIFTLSFSFTGCAKKPPKNMDNICSIFKEYPSWYWEAVDVHEKWGMRPSVLMAIIHQESHFVNNAAPPREKLLWIIPWKRPTSAYGYSQSVKATWKRYKKDTGHSFAKRTAFDDAADFVGWFSNQANRRAGVPINNAYDQYLAYHEGVGGYIRKNYKNQPWLIAVAKKVQRRANMYHAQLLKCENSLPEKPWWKF